MKVGILTFHNAHNFGATLQAYALKTCVEQLGHEVRIVNYRNEKIEGRYKKVLFPRPTLKTLHPKNWKQYIYDAVRSVYAQKEWGEQWEEFDAFIREKLLDNNAVSVAEKELTGLGLEAYLLGSDQIWSSFLLEGLDPVYFGNFKKKERIISYAASLANGRIAREEEAAFQELTKNIDVLSVREEKLAEQLAELLGREVATTVDPTLLLEAKDYEKILPQQVKHPLPDAPYVFAYFVVEEQPVADCAKKIAEELGLPLIELHYYHMPECSGENQYADFGPGEFLYYIKHAEYVVTNSFHGTVFSILYQRKFYSVYKKNGRVDNLLGFLDIPERHVENETQINTADTIDYEKAGEKLAAYKRDSVEFLKKCLKDDMNGI